MCDTTDILFHVLGPCHTVEFFLQFSTLGRCKIGKYKFPSQFANIFLTYQTFVANLHLLRVELNCKLQEPCDSAFAFTHLIGKIKENVDG